MLAAARRAPLAWWLLPGRPSRLLLHVAWPAATLLAWAPAARAYDSVAVGAMVDTSVGTTRVGDPLMFELGGEWAGIRSYRGHWLVQWDALLAARAGYLAAQHPFLLLAGGHGLAWGEGGYRWAVATPWSPYVGVRLGGDALVMGSPGAALDTVNEVDGVGGVVASGAGRVQAGASMLDGRYSLLLTAFAGEELDAAESHTPFLAFTQGGVGARFDIEKSLFASLEGAVGVTPTRTDAAHGLTDRTTRTEVTAEFRKIFHNGMWLGAALWVQRDADRVTYSAGQTYATGDPPTVGLGLSFGVRPWREGP